MEFTKLNYDDFYKFVMSGGMLLFLLNTSVLLYFLTSWTSNSEPLFQKWRVLVSIIIYLILAGILICWSGKKWYSNQKIMDEKLRAECELIKKEFSTMDLQNKSLQKAIEPSKKSALVEYKISSVLPGTVSYDLIDSGQVWFWISNKEDKKYKVYIEIEFISENYHKKVEESYYGGKKEWNLNAFTGIHAPGMPIPKEVIELAKKNKRIEIRISCVVKNEKDRLVEKKLPVSYIYNKKDKSWHFEP